MFSFFTMDIGIDLGTANTLVYTKGKGIVLNEPSVIAVDDSTKKVIAVGKAAKEMIGRAPAHIRVVRPLQDGVISDYMMTHTMLREFLREVIPERSFLTKARVVVGVPSGVTGVEKRAVEEVVRQMGAKEVYILDEPMAAAIGVGIPVDEPEGHMIADIGGGTSDIAIIALGGIVTSVSLRVAGDELDEAIVQYMRKAYNLLIGDKTAEDIKKTIGCIFPNIGMPGKRETMEAKGRDVLTGLPKSVTIDSSDMLKALEEPIGIIIEGIKNTLENAPPELSADISTNGMVLAGGGALIKGLDQLIQHQTGLKVVVAENALEAVAEGTGKSLEHIENVRRYAIKEKKY
ncbi:MAG: rod shape-determining protein [Eubacteriales bacterium]|nr:rod shape-determining protein [Eubacteriales bacterium]MDD3350372.1 rod shape-determining protein [Eubacteriales bacterium]